MNGSFIDTIVRSMRGSACLDFDVLHAGVVRHVQQLAMTQILGTQLNHLVGVEVLRVCGTRAAASTVARSQPQTPLD